MTIKQARKILGKDAEGQTNEDIKRDIEVMGFFAELMVDKIFSMSSKERQKLLKKA